MSVAPKLHKGLKRLLKASALRSVGSILAAISVTAMLVGYIVMLASNGNDMSSKLPELIGAATEGGVDSVLDRLGEALSGEIVVGDGNIVGIGGIIVFLIGTLLLPVAVGILPFVATILVWVGIGNISRENFRFRIALFAVLARIVLIFARGFTTASAASSGGGLTLASGLVLLGNICDIVMFLYVCDGIRELGGKLGHSDLLGKYHRIVIFYVLTAVFECVGTFLGVGAVGYVFQVLGYVSSFIAYRLYLRALRKGLNVVDGIPAGTPADVSSASA